jgi:hypothetical protein
MVTATDAEIVAAITVTNRTLPLSIDRHDYRVVQLSGS